MGKCAAVTIKLGKAGGLTEALVLAAEGTRPGPRIMVGGAINTSLGVAPALLIAQGTEVARSRRTAVLGVRSGSRAAV
jgi:L-alanine-DL-glutamate epimerase-like enolase superfamily enzyme